MLTVSIVTPSFQHGQYLEQTISSVLAQDYASIDYTVIDGASSDNTVDILKKYEAHLKWISEPDSGQAHAINKGFAMASGDIFAWLNSDDYYAPGAIRRVVEFFDTHPQARFLYGDAVGIDRKGREYGVRTHIRARQRINASDLDVLVRQYDFLVQPACFWRASLWHELGELDIALRYTLDYEYWMRIAKRERMYYLPVTLAYERLYGETKTGSGHLERMREIEHIATSHGGDGLPVNYRAEAAAHVTFDVFRQFLKGHVHEARSGLAYIRSSKPPLGRYLRYLAVMLFLGQRAVPSAWLWLNRLRTRSWRSSITNLTTGSDFLPK